VVQGLRHMGVSAADIEAEQQRQDAAALEIAKAAGYEEEFEVYEDNWDVWLFFLQVQTQWIYRFDGMHSVRSGLNNSAIESTLRMAGKARRTWPALLADLQVIELAVLAADREMIDKPAGS
jgi:hypothetical protein